MQKLHGINPAMAATPWSWKPPLHAAMHFHQRYAAASPPAAAASPPAAGDAVIPPAPAPASDPPKCKPLCSRHAQKTAADFKAMAAAAAASQEQNVAKAAAALSPYTSRSRAELRAYMRGPGAGVLKEHSLVFLHEQQPGSKQEYNAARDVLWSEVSSPAKRDLLEAIIAEGTFGAHPSSPACPTLPRPPASPHPAPPACRFRACHPCRRPRRPNPNPDPNPNPNQAP